MQNSIECPVCGSNDIKLFMSGIFDSEKTNVMECEECGLQFLDPMMTEEEEEEYYNGYYQKQKNRHFKAMNLEDLQDQSFRHYERYENIYADLIQNKKSILEIGCGTGGFLKFVNEKFPSIKLTAFERCSENTNFIQNCFKNKVRMIDDLKEIDRETFDCICAFGVFEHIRDSKTFLMQMRSLLRRNGALALNVPNKKHALVFQYNLEEFKKFTYMKQHYFTFTEKSHHILAKQTGFKVKGFNYMQVWGLDNQLSWLKYRRPRNFNDITDSLSAETLAAYQKDMIRNKTSDLVMALYERK